MAFRYWFASPAGSGYNARTSKSCSERLTSFVLGSPSIVKSIGTLQVAGLYFNTWTSPLAFPVFLIYTSSASPHI